jgi:two-component system cell cycle sensor histidine kinase/response regulator CckA
MRWLDDLSVGHKLTAIAIASAGAALVLACSAFVANELFSFRAEMVRRLSTQAQLVGRHSTSALVFKDPESATETLAALRAEPHVVFAGVYTAEDALFASYVRDSAARPLSLRLPAGVAEWHVFEHGSLVLVHRIDFDNAPVGTVLIQSDLGELTARLRRYGIIVVCVLLASFGLAHATAGRLQRLITGPVLQLVATAQAVSSRRDYSVRAVAGGRDEVGLLIHAFNDMLDQIQERDQALQESEEQYRLLFEGNPHPMWVYDPDTLSFLAVNEAAVRLYGYAREEFLRMTIKDIRPVTDVPELLKSLKGTSRRSDGPWRHLKKDGSTLAVTVSSSEIRFRGTPARLVLATDMTEKTRLEAQLLQAQKMEAVGRLAGGVAHDFNNLLGVITGYSEMIRKDLERHHPVQKRVDQIEKAAQRAAALTRQLLAFSRKEVHQPKVLDLNEVVADVDKMLQRLIGEDIELVVSAGADLLNVRADPGQIEQVIVNLVVNARDAMPQGGQVTIETASTFLDETYARTHAEVSPGPYVMLAVSDTGHGMDTETLSHIFEPFFTTKEESKGTGLGLATVFGIVKQSGGHISVYSEPGHGTTFKIYLPGVEDEKAAVEGVISAPLPQGTETILLVEDAEALRVMIRELLETAGYLVLESSDPEEALGRLRVHQGPVDLVLTDVVMPRMSGPDLVGNVRKVRPGIRALYMSGYTNEAIGRHGVLEQGTQFLQKPFTSEALLRKIMETLGRVPK